jgi:hypothetical protein
MTVIKSTYKAGVLETGDDLVGQAGGHGGQRLQAGRSGNNRKKGAQPVPVPMSSECRWAVVVADRPCGERLVLWGVMTLEAIHVATRDAPPPLPPTPRVVHDHDGT